MIIAICTKKASVKILYSFIRKILHKLGIEENFHPCIKCIYNKNQQLKAVPLKSEIRQESLFSPLLFNIIPEVLARTIRQGKAIEDIQVGKEELILCLFTDDMIFYTENPTQARK